MILVNSGKVGSRHIYFKSPHSREDFFCAYVYLLYSFLYSIIYLSYLLSIANKLRFGKLYFVFFLAHILIPAITNIFNVIPNMIPKR